MEQWLLLIRHMTKVSRMAKTNLLHANMVDCLHKILSLQVNNTFIIALCEICIEQLMTYTPH